MKKVTYSDIAKKLSKKKSKFEKLQSSFDAAEKFTGDRMASKYESKLDDLFEVQELSKTPEGAGYLKNGGKLYRYGGKTMYQDGGKPKILRDGFEDALTFKPRQFNAWGLDNGVSRMLQQPPFNESMYPSTKFNEGFEDALKFSPRKFDAWGLNSKGLSNKMQEPPYQDPNAPTYKFSPKSFDEMGLRGAGPFDISDYKFKAKPFNDWEEGLRGKVKPSGILNPSYEITPEMAAGREAFMSGAGSTTPARTGGTRPKTPKLNRVADLGINPLPKRGLPTSTISDRLTKIKPDVLGSSKSRMKDLQEKALQDQSVGRKLDGMDILGNVAPFMDNFANLISPTPNIPAPRFASPANIETTVNVDPQLNQMRRGMRNFNQSIDRTVGQAGQAAGYKGQALADYFRGVGDIMGQKENTERGLRNQQAQEIARTDMMNQQLGSQFDQQQLMRQEAERMRKIGNLTNLGEDFMTMSTDRKLRELDREKALDLKTFFSDLYDFDPELKKRFDAKLGKKAVDSNRYGGKIKKRVRL